MNERYTGLFVAQVGQVCVGTNGGFTTVAGTSRPRMSTVTAVPSAMSGGRNASAIRRVRVSPLRGREQAAQTARHTALLLGEQRLAPAELALVEAHHPSQPGLQRRDAGPELVAVERQPRFQPQRVACAEPRRLYPRVHDRSPHGRSRVGGHMELDTVFAGVPGASRIPGHAIVRDRLHGEARDRGRVREQRRQELARRGALHGDDGALRRDVTYRHHAIRRRDGTGFAERGGNARGVGRIGHHEELFVGDPPHDDVVDDVGVVGVEQVRVLRAPGCDPSEVVGERPLQQ